MNIDRFHELEQVAEIIGNTGAQTARAGLHVNPQVGDGSIKCTSTASDTSKFGVLISDREEIIACFLRHKWLVGIHCHVGSHGCALDMLWAAATSIFELAEAINAIAARKAVRVLDVVGGMSVSDGSDCQTRCRNFGSRLQFVPSRMSRCIGLARASREDAWCRMVWRSHR